jgi:hypothetical protein
MNSLERRTFCVAGLLVVAGALSLGNVGHATSARKSETFMEERAPHEVPGYLMVPGPEGGMRYTYKMDKGTYETLKPFGIVARQFQTSSAIFDTVLVSSDSHESFHDPKICFSAQGYTLGDQHVETLDVPGRGAIPFTVVEMEGPKSKSVAMYTYHGPSGFVATSKQLQLQMFKEVVMGRAPMDSTFYRFMPVTDGVGLDQLKDFVKTYMSVAAKQSGGFF